MEIWDKDGPIWFKNSEFLEIAIDLHPCTWNGPPLSFVSIHGCQFASTCIVFFSTFRSHSCIQLDGCYIMSYLFVRGMGFHYNTGSGQCIGQILILQNYDNIIGETISVQRCHSQDIFQTDKDCNKCIIYILCITHSLTTQLTHMFGWSMVHAWKFHGIIWILNMNHAWNTHEKSMDHGMTSQSHDRNHHIGQVCSHQRLWIRILTSPATCWIAVYSM